MNSPIKLAFLSGTPELNRELIKRMRGLYPELPLWVVSDFPPEDSSLPWIRYRASHTFAANLQRVRDAIGTHTVRLAAVMLVPNVPFRRMRLVALALSPRAFIAFNEQLHHFMLRPAQLPTIARHFLWRAKNTVRWLLRLDWPRLLQYAAAIAAGWVRPRHGRPVSAGPVPRTPGITVVIPSRTGKELLEAHLPAIVAEQPEQIVIVDNGSTDDTAAWLAATYPAIEVEHSPAPLSFARAVNRGIARARYSHVCLLNNDMQIEPGFFAALRRPFDQVPDLFCATAQIHFPPGQRREETGKTVFAQATPEDFPGALRCSPRRRGRIWVLYGSGGCSLYDAAKLASLGNVDEIYEPAYVEDLDLGYRAWQRGWPSVYVAGAVVEHRHRATTSRYYTEAELEEILERNYLRFRRARGEFARRLPAPLAAGAAPSLPAQGAACIWPRGSRSPARQRTARVRARRRSSWRSRTAASASSRAAPPPANRAS